MRSGSSQLDSGAPDGSASAPGSDGRTEAAFRNWFAALHDASDCFVWAGLFIERDGNFVLNERSAELGDFARSLEPLARSAHEQARLKISPIRGQQPAMQTAMAIPVASAGASVVCVAVLDLKLADSTRAVALFEAAAQRLATLSRATESPRPTPDDIGPLSAEDSLTLLALATPEFYVELFARLSMGIAPTMAVLTVVRGVWIAPQRTGQRTDLLPHGSRIGHARRTAILATARSAAFVHTSWPVAGFGEPLLELQLLEQHEKVAGAVTIRLPNPSGGEIVYYGEYAPADERIADDRLAQVASRVSALAPVLGRLRDERRQVGFAEALPRWLDPRRARTWLAATALVAAVWLALPAPYSVVGEMTLRASQQQAIVAPRDGFLVQANVQAGDLVTAGDVIAAFDTRELLLRRARVAAQMDQAQARRMSAIAAFETAAVQVANAEIEALTAEQSLIALLLDQSRIVASQDAVIVSGDMRERIGSAVRQGETMFELAPHGNLVAAITIAQKDLTVELDGRDGTMKLTALPFDTFSLRVSRVAIGTDRETGTPIFTAMAEIDGSHPAFRPGMQGVAQIQSGEAPRIWVLTRDLFYWLGMQLWRWAP